MKNALVLAKNDSLTPRMKRFAETLATTKLNRTEAALVAGCSQKSATQQAWRWWQMQEVREYHGVCVSLRLGDLAGKAVATIEELLDVRNSEVRLNAAKDVLDRTGFKPVERKQVAVQGTVSVVFDLSE